MNSFAKICLVTGKNVISNKFTPNTSQIIKYQSIVREFKSSAQLNGSIGARLNRIKNPTLNKTGRNSQQTITIDPNRAILLGGATIGLGGLCYYGIYGNAKNNSASLSAFERAAVWPDYVRHRIQSTYAYLAGGAVIAGASATALAQNPTFIRIMTTGGWLAPIGMLVVSVGAGIVCQMIPYPEHGNRFLNSKHLTWLLYAGSLGGMLAPVCLIGGPIIMRAAVYTGGIVGGLSAVAASAPSDRFLTWSGPLAMGLGVVVVSSIGSMFLSPMGRLGAGMAAVSLYGGLVLFSGFLLYDTQKVIHRAEQHPTPYPRGSVVHGIDTLNQRPFDPINKSFFLHF